MNRLFYSILSALCFLHATPVLSHDSADAPPESDSARLIQFPDTDGHKTLVLDPHTHSSFSDGHVWPRIRVEEALRDGLDAIAVTEHLEWQPHLPDIPHGDRNRAYDIAVDAAADHDVLVIPGSEITRQGEAGHINALFISDANAMLRQYQPDDPGDAIAYYRAMGEWPAQQAVDAAINQKAFLFWNHPWWSTEFPDHIPELQAFHRDNASNGKLHGIEIANGDHYSEEAFQIALDLNLTLLGSSDIHELIDWDYRPHEGGHRPVTLVLAKENTSESLREALFAGNTLVWFKNTLLAREPQMQEMLEASVSITSASYSADSLLLELQIENRSDVDFQMQHIGEHTFSRVADLILLKQHTTTLLTVKTSQQLKSISLPFKVLNAKIAPTQATRLTLSTTAIELRE